MVRAIEGWRCQPASRRESRDVGVPNTAEYFSACCAVCRSKFDRLPIAPRPAAPALLTHDAFRRVFPMTAHTGAHVRGVNRKMRPNASRVIGLFPRIVEIEGVFWFRLEGPHAHNPVGFK
jgi:hypothetical protein